jgi:type VI secretion system protein ImpH
MRDQKITLKQEIIDNASRFEFFEAVRTLLLLTKCPLDGPSGDSNPVLRFRSSATKNFPPGEVQDLKREDGLMKLFTHVIGLHGPAGVLPHHDRDMVSGGQPNLLMRDFLDIFNSRAITLFFRAWLTNRHDVSLEMHRRGVYESEDAFSMALLSLCGLGLPSTRNQRSFSDDVFASSVGLLSRPVRSASAIRRCVAAQFGVDVEVFEFIEERIHVPRDIQTRLDRLGAGHNVLGRSAIAGTSVPAHRQRFEIRLGPLTRTEFELLCPFDGADHQSNAMPKNIMFRRLVDLIRSILGRPLDFDVRLEVEAEAVQPTQLGSTRLGFDSWVCSTPANETRRDTVKRFNWDTLSRSTVK